jgi:hypothetical protein
MRKSMILSCLTVLAATGVLTSAGFLFANESPEKMAIEKAKQPRPPSKLDLVKKLAGNWVEVGEDGKPTGHVVTTYRITANGSAVEEKLFEGTDHEMVTIYNMDGDDLVLTHYCMLGNQPRMKAEKQTDPRTLVFNCAGGMNIKSEKDEHMHHAVITWKDDDHIHSEWQEVKEGKNTMLASFNLARQ